MKKYLFVLVTFFLIGCGTSPINYQATNMEIKQAVNLVEDLTWSQHINWRPRSFVITDEYMAWSISSVDFVVDSVNSPNRNVEIKSYYRAIDKVQLYSWKRKLQQWYVVGIINKRGSSEFVLHTRSLEDAKLFTNAMSSIVNFYKNKE